MTTKKTFLYYLSCSAGLILTLSSVSGCSSNLFDSSVDIDGNPALSQAAETKNSQKKNSNRRNQHSKKTQNTPVLTPKETANEAEISSQMANAYNEEIKAGEIKPYVPDANDKVGTLLPTIESLHGKENENPLAKISVSDVVNGKVDLNSLNSEETAENEVQVSLPPAFEPEENIQYLQPVQGMV